MNARAASIRKLIADTLDIDESRVTPDLAYHSIPEWSSLRHVNLMVRLFSEYGIGRARGDIQELTSVAAIEQRLGMPRSTDGPASADDAGDQEFLALRGVDRGLARSVMDTTEITLVDPDGAHLLYRGYDARALSRSCSFEAVARLFIEGALGELSDREVSLVAAGQVAARNVLSSFSLPGQHDYMRTFILRMAATDLTFARRLSSDPSRQIRDEGWALLGATSVLSTEGETPVGLSSSGIITRALAGGIQSALTHDELVTYLSRTMILQADHSSSASALALRVAVSAGAHLQDSVLSAVSTFNGPLHGGAIREVVSLLEAHSQDIGVEVDHRIGCGEPIPGFGHRVYKRVDPRVQPIREDFDEMSGKLNDFRYSIPIAELRKAMALHEQLGATANVDLYSGALWRLIGARMEQLVPIFTVARLCGWIAHAVEQHESHVLIRPQLKYTGIKNANL